MRLCLVILLMSASAAAQTTAPTTAAVDEMLDFGVEGLVFPPVLITNGHAPRTAQLLGEAYRRRDPVVWKRVQIIADLGRVALPEATPYLSEALKDPAPGVRAEAARSAAAVGDVSLLEGVEALVADADATVRREAVLSAATIAREHKRAATVIARGLEDAEPAVVAAALRAAFDPEHAALIARKLPALPKGLGAPAADALARVGSGNQAAVVLPLLAGDTIERVAAVRALGRLGGDGVLQSTQRMLSDPHPTVRREAVRACAKLARDGIREPLVLRMLGDPDPTVRAAAAAALGLTPSPDAVSALAEQLASDYPPLHDAALEALGRPRDAAVREATVRLAVAMLAHENPRRREDASFLLGRLRALDAIERHVALLQWDTNEPTRTDWQLVAQTAESLGLIGAADAARPLMTLVQAAPQALSSVQEERKRNAMTQAVTDALLALARLRHRPALAESERILQSDPLTCPSSLRAAGAFAVGVLSDPGTMPGGVNLFAIYGSPDEARETKLEAIKAVGNLRHAGSARRLEAIISAEPSPDIRWIAHWAYERCANTRVPYTPPAVRREPPVAITDLTR